MLFPHLATILTVASGALASKLKEWPKAESPIMGSLDSLFTSQCALDINNQLRAMWDTLSSKHTNYLTDDNKDPVSVRLSPKEYQQLLEQLRECSTDDPQALLLLAELLTFGHYSVRPQYAAGFAAYKQYAELTGDPAAQFFVGLLYSTGLFGQWPRDQARATLYYSFAAKGGDVRAQMAMSNRINNGIGMPQDCDAALRYLRLAANQTMEYFLDGPPGGKHLGPSSWHLADSNHGLYGNLGKETAMYDEYAEDSSEEILEYAEHMLEGKVAEYKSTLSDFFYRGSQNVEPDLTKSAKLAHECAGLFFTDLDAKEVAPARESQWYSVRCATRLGQMYMRGEGVEQNYKLAYKWFHKAWQASAGQIGTAGNGLGYMYRHGLGVKQNTEKAIRYFHKAAELQSLPALYNLGEIQLERGDHKAALRYFSDAATVNLPAMYETGEYYFRVREDPAIAEAVMPAGAYSDELTCSKTYKHFKSFNERICSNKFPRRWALQQWNLGTFHNAFVGFVIEAEQGSENGQFNAAYVVDECLNYDDNGVISESDKLSALAYWTRSSIQSNFESTLRMGDYYLYGIGTKPNAEKAHECYTGAAERGNLGLARWNLGWMHEHGIGVSQDFHLAKRHYDSALVANPDAYLAVYLSLAKLRFKIIASAISGFLGYKKKADTQVSIIGGPNNNAKSNFARFRNMVIRFNRIGVLDLALLASFIVVVYLLSNRQAVNPEIANVPDVDEAPRDPVGDAPREQQAPEPPQQPLHRPLGPHLGDPEDGAFPS